MRIPFIGNWKDSDDPVLVKLASVLKNNTKKAVTLSSCCGNHGDVGC